MQLEQIQGEVITSSLAFTKIRVDSQKIAKLKSSAAKSAQACRRKEEILPDFFYPESIFDRAYIYLKLSGW